MNTLRLSQPVVTRPAVLLVFTLITALTSLSLHGFWRGILPFAETTLRWPQILLVTALLAATFLRDSVRPLRGFVAINLLLLLSTWLLFTVIAPSATWTGWFGDAATPWTVQGGDLLLKIVQMLLMIMLLWSLGTKRSDLFLAAGNINAVAEPVRWLGIKGDTTWLRFGTNFGIIAMLIMAGLMALGFRSLLVADVLQRVRPLLPTILLYAALNALYEEITYKAAPLAQLQGVVGRALALWVTALMFGLGHFTERYFAPGMSVVLPTFLGYVLGKSMIETRGLAWAWLIHFGMDVVVFGFLALGIVAGQ
jgi:membrane protease YdiL (CAAX protease family)